MSPEPHPLPRDPAAALFHPIRRAAAGTRIWLRLLDQIWRLAGGPAELEAHGESSWASATFTGTRHRFALTFAGAEHVTRGERLIAALPEHEFTLPGQIVADAHIAEVHHALLPAPRLALTCELLLVEDR